MSWLNNITDLAGKAESLLNNIDQSAAVAISKASTPKKSDIDSKNIGSRSADVDDTSSLKESSVQSVITTSSVGLTSHVKQMQRREIERAKPQKQNDDALFDFLNSSQKVTKSNNLSLSHVSPKPKKLSKEEHKYSKQKLAASASIQSMAKEPIGLEVSRNSSYDSLITKKNGRRISDNGSLVSDHQENNSEPGMLYPVFMPAYTICH